MARAGRITTYMLVWTSLLLLFAAGVWWMVEHAPIGAIKPAEFTSKAAQQDSQSAATIDQTLSATDIQTKNATWTVNGDKGKVTLVANIQQGIKRKSFYSIDGGTITFLLKNKQTGTDQQQLVLTLANATYSKEAGLVKVRGTLHGNITAGGHEFLAEELSWDQSQHHVIANEISYSAPGVAVSGKQMSIDLETGEVRFNGPVDVGI